MNHYFTSTGERVTQRQIDRKRKEMYSLSGIFSICEGCLHNYAICHAHIIPQARCKQLRKTELIWDRASIFFGCYDCNNRAENVSSEAITKLKNFEYIKNYLEMNDIERFNKLPI